MSFSYDFGAQARGFLMVPKDFENPSVPLQASFKTIIILNRYWQKYNALRATAAEELFWSEENQEWRRNFHMFSSGYISAATTVFKSRFKKKYLRFCIVDIREICRLKDEELKQATHTGLSASDFKMWIQRASGVELKPYISNSLKVSQGTIRRHSSESMLLIFTFFVLENVAFWVQFFPKQGKKVWLPPSQEKIPSGQQEKLLFYSQTFKSSPPLPPNSFSHFFSSPLQRASLQQASPPLFPTEKQE